MRHRLLMLCGVLAPAVYVATVILGGILRPDYSQKAQAVSELIEAGAPNKGLLNPLFALYNLLTGAFGLGLFMTVRAAGTPGVGLSGPSGRSRSSSKPFSGSSPSFFRRTRVVPHRHSPAPRT